MEIVASDFELLLAKKQFTLRLLFVLSEFLLTLSKLLMAQYAEESAEKTDPLSLRLQVPILSAASSTSTADRYRPCASSSCPTTEISTNGERSSFIDSSWRYVGSSEAAEEKKKNKYLNTFFALSGNGEKFLVSLLWRARFSPFFRRNRKASSFGIHAQAIKRGGGGSQVKAHSLSPSPFRRRKLREIFELSELPPFLPFFSSYVSGFVIWGWGLLPVSSFSAKTMALKHQVVNATQFFRKICPQKETTVDPYVRNGRCSW